MNFAAFLAKSNLPFTFLAMVCSSVSSPLNATLTFIRILLQSGPAVGISFCLIIVRLGRVLPDARDKTWEASIRTPASRTRVPDQLALSFPKTEVQRNVDVWVNGSKDLPMGSLEFQKQGYVDSSGSSPKTLRSFLSLSAPV